MPKKIGRPKSGRKLVRWWILAKTELAIGKAARQMNLTVPRYLEYQFPGTKPKP